MSTYNFDVELDKLTGSFILTSFLWTL